MATSEEIEIWRAMIVSVVEDRLDADARTAEARTEIEHLTAKRREALEWAEALAADLEELGTDTVMLRRFRSMRSLGDWPIRRPWFYEHAVVPPRTLDEIIDEADARPAAE